MKDQAQHILILLILAANSMVDMNSATRLVEPMRHKGKVSEEIVTIADEKRLPEPPVTEPVTMMLNDHEASCSGAKVDKETPVPGSPSIGPATIILDKNRRKWFLKSHIDHVSCSVLNKKTHRPILQEVDLKRGEIYPLDAELDEKMAIHYKWPARPKNIKPVKRWVEILMCLLNCLEALLE
ncbi:uncharacterized protein PGTG_06569 [Puccinia graminis f. sp. tritici CRL 75-36-700-3]|uniref:Uncharacterized protein n=1 Tax=Puccinia graminis f. sp. tritici (strain CRL 75-36-700-3 / race SCCL) TaxID=418459 RepID=E3K8K4_PUCGT|nr:uncharacterized protein PGTG_06569 [Puccinia graminis f. sp. tritici CRL 75-36-700-3]EFP80613.1 hypothetical protein PGTG_06569 [Puccinia graminis f. sp. tritici CRL 75-36-700-3]